MRRHKTLHPGQVLREKFLAPSGLSQRKFAKRVGWSLAKLNLLLTGKRNMTADSALDLAAVLKTPPEMWMKLQVKFDLKRAITRRRKGVS